MYKAISNIYSPISLTINPDGSKSYYRLGKLHNDRGPAVLFNDGAAFYYQDGLLHRDDGGPAVTYPSGHREWYHRGVLHRVGGPAIIHADGRREYYKNGELLSQHKTRQQFPLTKDAYIASSY